MQSGFIKMRLSQHSLPLSIWSLVISVSFPRWFYRLVTSVHLHEWLPRAHGPDEGSCYRLFCYGRNHIRVLNSIFLIGTIELPPRRRLSVLKASISCGMGVISKWRPAMILDLFPGKSHLRELLHFSALALSLTSLEVMIVSTYWVLSTSGIALTFYMYYWSLT